MRDSEYAMVAFEGYRPPGVRPLLGIRHLEYSLQASARDGILRLGSPQSPLYLVYLRLWRAQQFRFVVFPAARIFQQGLNDCNVPILARGRLSTRG